MFQMKDEMQTAVKHNIRGGDGSPSSAICSLPSSLETARR